MPVVLINIANIKILKTKGFHKDTNTFFNKEKNIRKDILKNINCLKDKDEFLKLYNE